MARNRSKRKYLFAIITYFAITAISLLICFLAKAKAYVYLLVIMGVGVAFLVAFFVILYDVLYKLKRDDIDEVKKISTEIETSALSKKLSI